MGGTGPRTGYVLVLRLELSDTPGTLERVTCRNEAHALELTAKADAVEGVRVLEVGDRTFLTHQGGKLAVVPRLPLKTPDDLSVAYTPGGGPGGAGDRGRPRAGLGPDGQGELGGRAHRRHGRARPWGDRPGGGPAGWSASGWRTSGWWCWARARPGSPAPGCYPRGLAGGLEVALAGADVFVGVSGPGALPPALAATMAPEAIVSALANPVPEIVPDEVPPNVAVVATGRSDFPNQINNVLVFPGFFRGLLDARARSVTDDMKAPPPAAWPRWSTSGSWMPTS